MTAEVIDSIVFLNFLTTALTDTQERQLLRLDARTGKILWRRTVVTASPESMHRENSLASSTPVTDGERVFTSFQNGKRVDLQCYDFEGRQLWSVQPLEFKGEHGYSYTPLIYRELLILDCRQEGEAAVLALDKRTGKVRWQVAPTRRRISHITPLLIHDGRRQQLIVSGSDETRSLNPETGETLWWCSGPSDVAVAGLSYGDGIVFAAAGYPDRNRMGVRVDGSRRQQLARGLEVAPAGDLCAFTGLSRRTLLLDPRRRYSLLLQREDRRDGLGSTPRGPGAIADQRGEFGAYICSFGVDQGFEHNSIRHTLR